MSEQILTPYGVLQAEHETLGAEHQILRTQSNAVGSHLRELYDTLGAEGGGFGLPSNTQQTNALGKITALRDHAKITDKTISLVRRDLDLAKERARGELLTEIQRLDGRYMRAQKLEETNKQLEKEIQRLVALPTPSDTTPDEQALLLVMRQYGCIDAKGALDAAKCQAALDFVKKASEAEGASPLGPHLFVDNLSALLSNNDGSVAYGGTTCMCGRPYDDCAHKASELDEALPTKPAVKNLSRAQLLEDPVNSGIKSRVTEDTQLYRACDHRGPGATMFATPQSRSAHERALYTTPCAQCDARLPAEPSCAEEPRYTTLPKNSGLVDITKEVQQKCIEILQKRLDDAYAEIDRLRRNRTENASTATPRLLNGGEIAPGNHEPPTAFDLSTKRLLERAALSPSGKKIVDECFRLAEMLVEKNIAYADSALSPLRLFAKGLDARAQILVRLDDKLSRLARGSAAGEDVILDLLGYLVLYRIAPATAPVEKPAVDPVKEALKGISVRPPTPEEVRQMRAAAAEAEKNSPYQKPKGMRLWNYAVATGNAALLLQWFRQNPDNKWAPGGFVARNQADEMVKRLCSEGRLVERINDDGSRSYIVGEPEKLA